MLISKKHRVIGAIRAILTAKSNFKFSTLHTVRSTRNFLGQILYFYGLCTDFRNKVQLKRSIFLKVCTWNQFNYRFLFGLELFISSITRNVSNKKLLIRKVWGLVQIGQILRNYSPGSKDFKELVTSHSLKNKEHAFWNWENHKLIIQLPQKTP